MEKHGRSALRSISTKIAAWCMVGLFLATSFAMIGDVSATNPSGSPLPIVASGNIDSLNEFSPCATFQDTIEKLGSTYYLIFENGNNLCYRTTTDLNSSWSGTDVSFFAIGATHIPYMVALTKTAGGSDEIGIFTEKFVGTGGTAQHNFVLLTYSGSSWTTYQIASYGHADLLEVLRIDGLGNAEYALSYGMMSGTAPYDVASVLTIGTVDGATFTPLAGYPHTFSNNENVPSLYTFGMNGIEYAIYNTGYGSNLVWSTSSNWGTTHTIPSQYYAEGHVQIVTGNNIAYILTGSTSNSMQLVSFDPSTNTFTTLANYNAMYAMGTISYDSFINELLVYINPSLYRYSSGDYEYEWAPADYVNFTMYDGSGFSPNQTANTWNSPYTLEGISSYYDPSTSSSALILDYTLYGANGAISVLYQPTITTFTSGDWVYTVANNVATIIGYLGSASDIVVPSILGGHAVIAMGDDIWSSNYVIQSVTIPDSIVSIGNGTFEYSGLEYATIGTGLRHLGEQTFDTHSLFSINVSAGNPYLSSQDGVLYDKAKTELIQYSDQKDYDAINDTMFWPVNFVVPSTVKAIGDYAFDGCSISNFTFPSGLTFIGNDSFTGDIPLWDIVFPNSLRTIGNDSFSDGYLYNVTFGTGIGYIGDSAFSNNILASVNFLGLTAPSDVADDWADGNSGALGHAYNTSDFPAPGDYFHGLLMGDYLPAYTPPVWPLPAFTTAPIGQVAAHHAYLYLAQTTGLGMTYALLTNASFLSIDPGSGQISGATGAHASYYLEITATNSTGEAWQNFTLYVNDTTPTIISTDIPQGMMGSTYSQIISASGTDLMFSMLTNASFLSIDPTTGDIYGIPPSSGSWYVAVTVTNSAGSDSRNFTLDVVGGAPIFVTVPIADGTVGSVYAYVAGASGTSVNYTLTTNATFLSIDRVLGTIVGIPDKVGYYLVCVTATNSYGWANQTYVIQVTAATTPAVPKGTSRGASTILTTLDLWGILIIALCLLTVAGIAGMMLASANRRRKR